MLVLVLVLVPVLVLLLRNVRLCWCLWCVLRAHAVCCELLLLRAACWCFFCVPIDSCTVRRFLDCVLVHALRADACSVRVFWYSRYVLALRIPFGA